MGTAKGISGNSERTRWTRAILANCKDARSIAEEQRYRNRHCRSANMSIPPCHLKYPNRWLEPKPNFLWLTSFSRIIINIILYDPTLIQFNFTNPITTLVEKLIENNPIFVLNTSLPKHSQQATQNWYCKFMNVKRFSLRMSWKCKDNYI